MSIVQDALKKAQGGYVEKKMPCVEVFHEIKKTKSVRLPVLLGIFLILGLVYALMLSLQYIRIHNRNIAILEKIEGKIIEQKDTIVPSVIADKTINPVSKPEIGAAAPPLSKFVLNGIMYVKNKPQAIINGYILEEGDELNGATIMVIEKDCVLLDMNDENIRLDLAKQR